MTDITDIATLTSAEVAARVAGGALLAVPVGSTEQHGPHLPLSTDTDLAVALCRRLAQRRDALVAPAVGYGASGEHAGFAGTLSIGHEALELLLVELCRSAADTVERIVLVNAHGGNVATVRRAVSRLRYEGRPVLAYFAGWPGDAHAGRTETSLQLALHPDRVRVDRAAAGNAQPLAELMPVLRERGVRAVSPNGVLGDPAGASAAEGLAVLDAMADKLARAVDAWLGVAATSGAASL
jgi:mycofactocin precursor peptide peptidase